MSRTVTQRVERSDSWLFCTADYTATHPFSMYANGGFSYGGDPSVADPYEQYGVVLMDGELTFRSSYVIFPERRNVHGKLFGGFVMAQAYNLALYTSKVFARGGAVEPLGIDEAVFLQPISIGDLVTFTARLVHATQHTCRVFVTVEVRDAADPGRLPLRSNRLIFPFAAKSPPGAVLPNTYREMLMHIEAERRWEAEGPTEEWAQAVLSQGR